MDDPPEMAGQAAKSTLQLFRAQLIPSAGSGQALHDRVRAIFQRSLQYARQTGFLKGRRMKVAVDTTYIQLPAFKVLHYVPHTQHHRHSTYLTG